MASTPSPTSPTCCSACRRTLPRGSTSCCLTAGARRRRRTRPESQMHTGAVHCSPNAESEMRIRSRGSAHGCAEHRDDVPLQVRLGILCVDSRNRRSGSHCCGGIDSVGKVCRCGVIRPDLPWGCLQYGLVLDGLSGRRGRERHQRVAAPVGANTQGNLMGKHPEDSGVLVVPPWIPEEGPRLPRVPCPPLRVSTLAEREDLLR